jgi:hypothetical protein
MNLEVYADCVQSLAVFLSFVEKHCDQFDHVLFRASVRTGRSFQSLLVFAHAAS